MDRSPLTNFALDRPALPPPPPPIAGPAVVGRTRRCGGGVETLGSDCCCLCCCCNCSSMALAAVYLRHDNKKQSHSHISAGTHSRNIGLRERAALAAIAAVAACTAADGPPNPAVFGRPLNGLSWGGGDKRGGTGLAAALRGVEGGAASRSICLPPSTSRDVTTLCGSETGMHAAFGGPRTRHLPSSIFRPALATRCAL
jgi:hypothetical protein